MKHSFNAWSPEAATSAAPSIGIRVAGLLFLLLLSFPLFFHSLGTRDLWSSHEGRAAQDAQSMLGGEGWGLPRLFDRQIDLQKPPLFYWLAALVGRVQGSVDAWAVRLPAAGAALMGMVALYGLGLARGRPRAGFIAAVVLGTCLHYTWLGRIGRIDMPLAAAVSAALTCGYIGYRRTLELSQASAWPWFLASYLALASAIMLKGPIGLILIGAVVAALFVSQRRNGHGLLSFVRSTGMTWGLPLVLALTLPWFLWAQSTTGGEFVRVFFWKHNIARGLGSSEDLAVYPWWFYLPRLSFDLLPWSLVIPVGAWLHWNRRDDDDPEARFGLVWFAVIVLLLSCMSFKRADYLLPAYGGLALWLGCVLERYAKSVPLAAACGLAMAVGWWGYVDWVLPDREPMLESRRFAYEIRIRAPAPQLVLFFRAEAHALAFHVGRPVETLLEWENLDAWAEKIDNYFVVMREEDAQQWQDHLRRGRLEVILRNTDVTDKDHVQPLVLLRTLPRMGLEESVAQVRGRADPAP